MKPPPPTKRRRKPHLTRSCPSGKTRYRSRDEALRTLHALRTPSPSTQPDRAPRSLLPSRTYACPDCAGFHLTSTQKRGTAEPDPIHLQPDSHLLPGPRPTSPDPFS